MYSNCYILTNYYRKRFIFFRSTFVIRSPTGFFILNVTAHLYIILLYGFLLDENRASGLGSISSASLSGHKRARVPFSFVIDASKG
jgi:hypothetical protein